MCFVLIGITYGEEIKLVEKKPTRSECEVIRDGILGARKDDLEKSNALSAEFERQVQEALALDTVEEYEARKKELLEKYREDLKSIHRTPYDNFEHFEIF